MFKKSLLMMSGIIFCGSFFLSSCAPTQRSAEGTYGRVSTTQGPPPMDWVQPVIDQRTKYRQEMAREARDTAYVFQRQNLVKQAVIKYRESLAWWPDPTLDKYIDLIEKSASLPPSGKRASWTNAPRPPSKKQELVSTIRNRSSEDVYVFSYGRSENPESRFLPGEIREMAILPDAYGQVIFSATRGNGPIIATVTWTGDPEDTRIVPVVVFDDRNAEKLVVMTGFRSK